MQTSSAFGSTRSAAIAFVGTVAVGLPCALVWATHVGRKPPSRHTAAVTFQCRALVCAAHIAL